jgi:hypothetical protein
MIKINKLQIEKLMFTLLVLVIIFGIIAIVSTVLDVNIEAILLFIIIFQLHKLIIR